MVRGKSGCFVATWFVQPGSPEPPSEKNFRASRAIGNVLPTPQVDIVNFVPNPVRMTFAAASAVEPVGPNRFRAVVPDGWQQGRGAFGGLSLGTLARAMLATESDPKRTLRTFSGDVVAPVLPGEATIDVTTLRRGHYLTNVDATMRQNGEVVARASSTLSLPRPAEVADRRPTPPSRPPFERAEVAPIEPPVGPVFARHYEYRPTRKWAPAADGQLLVAGYVREREPPPTLDAPAVIGLLDAYYPTLFALDGNVRPIATVSFTAEILTDLTTVLGDGTFFHDAKLSALHGGFFLELRELWLGDRLIAMNQQTFCVLK